MSAVYKRATIKVPANSIKGLVDSFTSKYLIVTLEWPA